MRGFIWFHGHLLLDHDTVNLFFDVIKKHDAKTTISLPVKSFVRYAPPWFTFTAEAISHTDVYWYSPEYPAHDIAKVEFPMAIKACICPISNPAISRDAQKESQRHYLRNLILSIESMSLPLILVCIEASNEAVDVAETVGPNVPTSIQILTCAGKDVQEVAFAFRQHIQKL
jgi:hypothetical protein